MVTKGTNGSESGVTDAENQPNNDGGEVIYRSDDSGIPTVEPTVIAGEPETGEPTHRTRRKRGTSPGYAAKHQQKQTGQDLTGILLGLHFMASAITKVPELELTEAEAKKIGDAVARVNTLYDGFIFTDKQMAWAGLVMACGAVYGPRFVAYNLRVKNEKQEGPVTIDASRVM